MNILKKGSFVENKSYPLIAPKSRSFNIDSVLDFKLTELYI